jgi:hypothetical protein
MLCGLSTIPFMVNLAIPQHRCRGKTLFPEWSITLSLITNCFSPRYRWVIVHWCRYCWPCPSTTSFSFLLPYSFPSDDLVVITSSCSSTTPLWHIFPEQLVVMNKVRGWNQHIYRVQSETANYNHPVTQRTTNKPRISLSSLCNQYNLSSNRRNQVVGSLLHHESTERKLPLGGGLEEPPFWADS